jgi:hypothetical protein
MVARGGRYIGYLGLRILLRNASTTILERKGGAG